MQLENSDDILSVTDGIMVARGDLAMDVGTISALRWWTLADFGPFVGCIHSVNRAMEMRASR
jgi:hypothetical protein